MTLRSLNFRRDYSNFLTLSNVGELVRNISKSRKRKKNAFFGEGWGVRGGRGCISFLVRFFFGDLSFLDLGGGGGGGGGVWAEEWKGMPDSKL